MIENSGEPGTQLMGDEQELKLPLLIDQPETALADV
jgi:hypothetical protein